MKRAAHVDRGREPLIRQAVETIHEPARWLLANNSTSSVPLATRSGHRDLGRCGDTDDRLADPDAHAVGTGSAAVEVCRAVACSLTCC